MQWRYAASALTFVRHVPPSVKTIKQNIAKNVPGLVNNVHKNAEKWLLKS